ncbi:IS630 family transposase [Paeniglutamicibacter psychrophenolicus]|uniref:Transposase n=1 Tax=Paeniglutamicibacter psychrophenolicus TaxID=257454 RepID=A0ABS4WB10_9MICC|nr:IS630 family transposase [Paeniglutamicibacter psychrophenolicus]MBP2373226.1 transposase [Paeniglutamicibacter psychrophenolicus]
MKSPFPIHLDPAEQRVLEYRARGSKRPHREVERARIILAAARGEPLARIATALGIHVDTVRKWCKRFAAEGMRGLKDRHRSGRPRVFTPVQVAGIKALACTPPTEKDLPLSRMTTGEIRDLAVAEHLVDGISLTTIWRWLDQDAIKPWQHRSWIFPRDPDFAAKAGRVLDLYARTWNGQPLGPEDYVVSADEKSQIQALHRRHPSLAPGPGRATRIEFEYSRGGTLAYLAAYDVHRGLVAGSIAPSTGIAPFMALAGQVMAAEPYASAHRVFWVVDNGSSHNRAPSIARMSAAWPNATLVHLPVHASWLNQVEIYFSILQRRAIAGADFPDLDALAERIMAFQERYNATADPFDWRYTRHDLNDYLHRLAAHEPGLAA